MYEPKNVSFVLQGLAKTFGGYVSENNVKSLFCSGRGRLDGVFAQLKK